MLLMLLFMMFLVILIPLLIFVNFILMKKEFKDREKISSFECGFDPLVSSRLPFSLQFYLISIIFLIFDVEIALVLPLIFINLINYYLMIFISIIIFILLLMGLYLEWLEGSLKWFK